MKKPLFSGKEIRELTISSIVLAYAFGGIENFFLSLLIIGVVFIFHELAHRQVARHFGFWAEYRMWPLGLFLAIIGSFFGFVFAAPGAVYISPIKSFAWNTHRITKKENGLIALSGPLTNIIIGFLLLGGLFYFPVYTTFFYLGSRISFFLALFNMLPFAMLDGKKVLDWNWIIWGINIAIAIIGYLLLQSI